MNNIMNLVNRILDAIQNSAQARRLLGFSVIALAVLYWLTRRSSRSRRPNQGGRQSDDMQPAPPTITLSPGFHRVPVQQKVSLITNDSIFDSWELSSIDSAASSAAAAASRPVPSALRLLPSGLPSLLELARACDLYVITQCSSDATEQAVRQALSDTGAVAAGLNPHKILFCETEVGRGAMVRQLEPALHLDSSASTVQALAPYVPAIAAVRTPANVEAMQRLGMAPHITPVDDLAQYFLIPAPRQRQD